MVDGSSIEPGVVSRTFAILGCFTATTAEHTLASISATSGLPLTTVHRLCAQLLDERILERTPGRRLRIGTRLWELGVLAPRAHGLRRVALPYMEDIYEVSHENVQLSVLDGDDMLLVERISAHNAVALVSQVGGRLPMHASSGGLVYLSFGEPELLTRTLANPLPRFTSRTITTEDGLRRAVYLARQQGFSLIPEALAIGTVAVAVPVFGNEGLSAALSVVVSVEKNAVALVPVLRAASRGIGRGLRASSGTPLGPE